MMDSLPPALPTARDILQLEVLGEDLFRSCHNLDNLMGVAFGGQLLGQALAAAQRTVPDWPANSLTGYFMSAGLLDEPLDFAVTRCRDGRQFAIRHVSATQGSRAVFELSCSFHNGEAQGPAHQFEAAGDLPDPDTLPSLQQFAALNKERLPSQALATFERVFPIELRFINPEDFFCSVPRREFWFRTPSAAGIESASDHQAVLAFMSDYWLPASIGASHARSEVKGLVSQNHAMWFHAPADTGDWLFYRSTSPWAGHGRGLARGSIFDRSGRLVATTMQEAALRS
jgi:acyl-CoA thioesterase II